MSFYKTLIGSGLHMYTSGSEATVRYVVVDDSGVEDPLGTNENSLYYHYTGESDMPDFGDYGDFAPISTGKYDIEIDIEGEGKTAFSQQRLRVEEFHSGQTETKNGLISFVDVVYRSRPMPTIDFDSSLTQAKTQMYLKEQANPQFNGMNYNNRIQMTLGYTALANSYATGFPATNQKLLKVPVTATKLQFGQSVRVSCTYYDDEVNESQWSDAMSIYNQSINSQDLFFTGDARMWLCANFSTSSQDGGWKRRAICEFVFNFDGWDSVVTYTDPFTGQSPVLTQATVDALYTSLKSDESVPKPYNPDQIGVGRFPQYQAVDLSKLYLFMRQTTELNQNSPADYILPATI